MRKIKRPPTVREYEEIVDDFRDAPRRKRTPNWLI